MFRSTRRCCAPCPREHRPAGKPSAWARRSTDRMARPRAWPAPLPTLRGPILRDLRRHDAFVRYVAFENSDVARELVHAGDEVARDRCIVVGQIAADQLGDQL